MISDGVFKALCDFANDVLGVKDVVVCMSRYVDEVYIRYQGKKYSIPTEWLVDQNWHAVTLRLKGIRAGKVKPND